MVMEFGKDSMEIHILENGDNLRQKVMAFILGKMVIGMKENGKYVLNMDKEQIFFAMEMYIQENIRMVSLMVKGNIHGEMVKSM